MAKIQKLKDEQNTDVYPLTHERAVVDSSGVKLETKLNGIESRLSSVVEMTPISTTTGKFFHTDGERESDAMEYKLYSVTPGEHYEFSGKFHNLSSSVMFVVWLDSNQQYLSSAGYHAAGTSSDAVYTGTIILAPTNAAYAAFNIQILYESQSSFGSLEAIDFDELVDDVSANTVSITELGSSVTGLAATSQTMNEAISQKSYSVMTPVSDTTGQFINNSGAVKTNASTGYRRYNVVGGGKYAFSGKFTSGFDTIRYFAIYQSDGTFIRTTSEYPATTTQYTNQELTMPINAGYVLMNYRLTNSSDFNFSDVVLTQISSSELDNRIDELESRVGSGTMKVHIYSMNPSNDGDFFYIRSKYNSDKDIILLYCTNYNSLIRPDSAYIGANNLSDSEIMTSDNKVSSHTDSTAPLFNSSVYWHLFAQHGYVIPTISNNAGFTSSDVGAVWQDQLSRQYTIGKVTTSTVSLLPVFYQDSNGHTTRGWKTPSSTSPTTMTHVSGGVVTESFTVSGASYTQLRPIMQHADRALCVDGTKVTSAGDYYCNEFKANESQMGYDPETVSSWFPINLTNAEVMAKFTWSYNFFGPNCAVNTTIQILREVECLSYGATQQQTFYDVTKNSNTYKAMFIIPKATNNLDKPFNSPSSSSPTKMFYRDSASLKDVNDPIDRLIAYLYDDVNGNYLVGMSAGLSLVSGDTITSKRINNLPLGNTNGHYRVGSLSPENRNKFYISAVNTAPFESNQYYFPVGYFKEINYYVSYFDPAENPGQVYWYKDGSKYVVYIHCQEALTNTPIKLPEVMEGLSLSIVEKTDGATLLSSSVQNGKVFVSFTNAANYIVAIVS